MTAAYRLKGLGWFAGGVLVTLAFYLVSLQVAGERKHLEQLNRQIATGERDIRALETEFDTRANLAQLDRWNSDTLGLVAPQAAQFVPDEDRLAALDARQPSPAVTPVFAAAVRAPAAEPAAEPAAKPAIVPARVEQVAAVADADAPRPIHAAALRRLKVTPDAAPAAVRPRMAMLDRKLLSDATLSDLASAARAEKARRR